MTPTPTIQLNPGSEKDSAKWLYTQDTLVGVINIKYKNIIL